jgi:molecular chaperone HscB
MNRVDVQACAGCAAPLTSSLCCETCGALVQDALSRDPFAVFGIPIGYGIDLDALRKRLLRLSRRLHPDFHGGAAVETRALAVHHSAELNSAHELLADDSARADWLVRHLGGPSEQQERAMPHAFLLEVLEWSEALEAARTSLPGSSERAALAQLEEELAAQRRAQLSVVARALDPLPEHGSARLLDARRALNAIRYIDRACGEIRELALAPSDPQQ